MELTASRRQTAPALLLPPSAPVLRSGDGSVGTGSRADRPRLAARARGAPRNHPGLAPRVVFAGRGVPRYRRGGLAGPGAAFAGRALPIRPRSLGAPPAPAEEPDRRARAQRRAAGVPLPRAPGAPACHARRGVSGRAARADLGRLPRLPAVRPAIPARGVE